MQHVGKKKKKNKHLKCAVTVPKMPMVYLLQMITFFVVVPLCSLCKILSTNFKSFRSGFICLTAHLSGKCWLKTGVRPWYFRFGAYLVNLMMFIFIINDCPILHCTGQISRLCLLLGELYGSDNRVLFYLYGEKKSVNVAIRKTSSKTTTVTRSYTKDQVNRNR